jgi:hypothetical protein
MLLGFSLADAAMAFWLMGGVGGHNVLTWSVIGLGLLAAAVYNFKVCEFQALSLQDG